MKKNQIPDIPEASPEEVEAFMARQQQPSSGTIGDENLKKLAQLKPEAQLTSLKEKLADWQREVTQRPPVTDIRQRIREIASLAYPTYYALSKVVEEAEELLQKAPWLSEHPEIKTQQGALEEFRKILAEQYRNDCSAILSLLQKVDEVIGKALRQIRSFPQLNELLEDLTRNQLVWRSSRVASEELKEGVVLGERVYLPYRGNDLSLVAFPQIREVCNTITEAWEAKREAHREHRREFESQANMDILEALEGKEGILLVRVLTKDQTSREKPALILLQIGRRRIGSEVRPAYRILKGLEPWVLWVENYAHKDGKERWFALNPPEFRIEGIVEGTGLYHLVNEMLAPALATQYQAALEKEKKQAERQAQKERAFSRRKELLADPGISPVALQAGESGICNYRLQNIKTRNREDDITLSIQGNGQGMVRLLEYISAMKFAVPEKAINLDGVVGKEIPLSPPEGVKEEGLIRFFRYILSYMADDYRAKELAQSSTVTATQFVDEGVTGICAFINPKAQIGDREGQVALAYERERENGPIKFKQYISLGGVFNFDRIVGREIPLDPPEGQKEDGAIFHLRRFLKERRNYEKWVAAARLPKSKVSGETSEEKGDVSSGEES